MRVYWCGGGVVCMCVCVRVCVNVTMITEGKVLYIQGWIHRTDNTVNNPPSLSL